MIHTKKLIEVALPLEAINLASAREKSIRHGHPSTLHLWWARRPLAAARAVIFAQMVDDPSAYVQELRDNPKLRRKAEGLLKARQKVWEEVRRTFELAEGAGIAAPAPGVEPTLDDILAEQERERLFRIIEDLVIWENTTNEKVLQAARDEIWQSWRRTCALNADHPRAKELFDRNVLPAFHDPFAGGGALPLEAQRLGLESYASDLNPVAVLINKAMIEIPPKFAGRPPVNPDARKGKLDIKTWHGAQGLAEDVRYYGQWMRDESKKRIGHLYPKIEITSAMAQERPDLEPIVGQKLTVIAWLWVRTVKSPNPAFRNVDVPLASNFMLATKPGKEAWVLPVIEDGGYRFMVKVGKPTDAEAAESGTKLARGANFGCVMSGTPIASDYIKAEGKAERMGARLMAIVAEGQRGRVYLSPTPEHEAAAAQAKPEWKPEGAFVEDARAFTPFIYGLGEWRKLFTDRQLVALTTFSDLIGEVSARVCRDAEFSADEKPLHEGGVGINVYAEAITAYLALALDRLLQQFSTLSVWSSHPAHELVVNAFTRQALTMTWDYGEVNPYCDAASWDKVLSFLLKALEVLGNSSDKYGAGCAIQLDAMNQALSAGRVVSTDPPYYDNVPYADLSDFFYVWLRRSLRTVFPDLFSTLAVPKVEELVAFGYRHEGGKQRAEAFFLSGMTKAMHRLASLAHPSFPVSIFYAFKQAETDVSKGTTSTGWETFLDGALQAGFGISGTWPVRTEKPGRMRAQNSNALASSIVLVCRARETSAPTATRREFLSALKAELPVALRQLQQGNIAPVDLAQAAIGPGMAVFTRYAQVLDTAGHAMRVHEALALINQTLDETLAEQEGDFDADTRWALTWFDQVGFGEGKYGDAETISNARNTSIAGLVRAGIIASKGGKVRLLSPSELPADWDPQADMRLTAWEAVHHLVRVLESGGEQAAAALAAQLGPYAETARELAYRLYATCERKKRAQEALSYNGLVQSWSEISRLALEGADANPNVGAQVGLFGGE